VSVGDQDHGRVAVAVASMLAGAVHQPLDLLLGEVSAGSALPNCQVYSGWRRGLGCWKHRGNLPVFIAHCAIIESLLHSCKWLFPRLFYSASQLFGHEIKPSASLAPTAFPLRRVPIAGPQKWPCLNAWLWAAPTLASAAQSPSPYIPADARGAARGGGPCFGRASVPSPMCPANFSK